MYVEPQSNIRLLKGVNLDSTYEHTIYFNNATEQMNYFASKTKHTFSNVTYNRVNKGVARLQVGADDVYDCNYMMFQNIGFGNKWFYAFINHVEYINNITCEIYFEIDDMQTWAFDYTLGMNYVEREHSATDNATEYYLPEPVDIGDYIVDDRSRNAYLDYQALDTVVATSFNPTSGDILIMKMDTKIYNGIYYKVFETYPGGDDETGQGVTDYLNSIVSQQGVDSIVSVFVCPHAITKFYLDQITSGYSARTARKNDAILFDFNKAFASFKEDNREYVPKNKKMYTYPYNFVYLYDNIGNDTSILKPQFLETPDGYIHINASMGLSTVPSCVLYPERYKGKTDNVEAGITLDKYPQCAYNIDTVRAYIANGGMYSDVINLGSSMVFGALALGVGAGTGGMGAVATGTALAVAGSQTGGAKPSAGAMRPMANIGSYMSSKVGMANAVNQLSHNLNKPDTTRTGSVISGLMADSEYYPIVERRHINVTNAIAIDNFFTKYGYACQQLKVPNRNVRPHWCYTQTVNCVLDGISMPADAEAHICSIYDKGITFWKNGDEIGNYSLDNSV